MKEVKQTMKKEWNQPALEELSIKMTLTGNAVVEVDMTFNDEDETAVLHGS